MADGFSISARGLDTATKLADAMAARALNLRPALTVFGAELTKRVDDAFQNSKSPAGEIWPTLAPSTVAKRAAKLPGAKRRGKDGKLTKGAKQKRVQGAAAYQHAGAGNIKALVDTARMRNSQNVRVDATSLLWSAVGYMAPHITGSQKRPGRPPKRNPAPFELNGGKWELTPALQALLARYVSGYITTGKVSGKGGA